MLHAFLVSKWFGVRRMGTWVLGASLLLPSLAAAERMTAELNAYQSVPALAAEGSGRFVARIKSKAARIEYRLYYEDLASPVLQSHIHFGNAWENGGVIAFLCTNLQNAPRPDVPACPQGEGVVSGFIEAADILGPGGERGIQAGDYEALLEAIDAGAVYVNVHTEAYKAGQIRGQID